MTKIYLYKGKGAYLPKIEKALKILKFPYQGIREQGLKAEKLSKIPQPENHILIVPGGYPEKYRENLKEKGFQEIKKFVKNGAKYIGICGGAYLASREFLVWKKGARPRQFKGLGIFKGKCLRKGPRRNAFLREINLRKHLLTQGVPFKLKIPYHNGPFIKGSKGVEIVAFYENYENREGAIAYTHYGKGQVILFGPHPEGGRKRKFDPVKLGTLNLLKNALEL